MTQLEKLLRLRDAVDKALGVAAADVGKPPHQQRLFASIEGMALTNAAFDFFGCDDLYSLSRDIERDVCGPDETYEATGSALDPLDPGLAGSGPEAPAKIPDMPRVTQQVRKLNQSLFVDGEVR